MIKFLVYVYKANKIFRRFLRGEISGKQAKVALEELEVKYPDVLHLSTLLPPGFWS